MSTNRMRFLSGNPHKISEVRQLLAAEGIEIVPVSVKVEELQTTDVKAMVEDKCTKAFYLVGWPLFVEQTGLSFDALNGFPAGLTQVFWDSLEADELCRLMGRAANQKVVARTDVAYCDGRRLHHFYGEVSGQIAMQPRGPRDFQWDCVFIPDGETDTFAEMGDRKHSFSMRAKALKKLVEHLSDRS